MFTLYSRLYNRLDNYANERSQAALTPASQDVYDVIARYLDIYLFYVYGVDTGQ